MQTYQRVGAGVGTIERWNLRGYSIVHTTSLAALMTNTLTPLNAKSKNHKLGFSTAAGTFRQITASPGVGRHRRDRAEKAQG